LRALPDGRRLVQVRPASAVALICPTGKSAVVRENLSILPRKNIPLCPSGKSSLQTAPSRLDKRGASRSSRTLGAGCGGRVDDARRAALTRTAKSCGPDAPTLASSFRGLFPRKRRWQKSPVTGESTKETVKTIAQGRPDCFGEPVVTMLVCFFISHARLRVHRAPGFPCALCFQRVVRTTARVLTAPRDREVVFDERERATFSSVIIRESGDPVFRCVCDGTEKLRRTGYPACAGYDDGCKVNGQCQAEQCRKKSWPKNWTGRGER
jgi:hypothetical protein